MKAPTWRVKGHGNNLWLVVACMDWYAQVIVITGFIAGRGFLKRMDMQIS